jgi:hypothetical protein
MFTFSLGQKGRTWFPPAILQPDLIAWSFHSTVCSSLYRESESVPSVRHEHRALIRGTAAHAQCLSVTWAAFSRIRHCSSPYTVTPVIVGGGEGGWVVVCPVGATLVDWMGVGGGNLPLPPLSPPPSAEGRKDGRCGYRMEKELLQNVFHLIAGAVCGFFSLLYTSRSLHTV